MRIKFSIICLTLSFAAGAAPHLLRSSSRSGVTWDFENDAGNWKPRAATVKVQRVAQAGASENPDDHREACLHIYGKMQGNWNYAISNSVPMQAGHLY